LAHPNIEEMNKIKRKIEEEDDELTRVIVRIERGDGREFEHLQGYLSFENHFSGWQMKRIWSDRAHWDKVKGTAKQNHDYYSKEQNILAVKGFEKIVEHEAKERKQNEYWIKAIQVAMRLTPTEFAHEDPKE
jgi:hypothetical protein